MVFYVESIGLSVADFSALLDNSVPLKPSQRSLDSFIVEVCRVSKHADGLVHVSKQNGLVEQFCYRSTLRVPKEAS